MTALIHIQNANIYIGQQKVRPDTADILRSPTSHCPGAGGAINVNPVNSTLGTICASAVYGPCAQTGKPPKKVYANVYVYNSLPGGSGSTSVAFPGEPTAQSAPQSQSNP